MTTDSNDGQKVVSLMGMLEENKYSAITEMSAYWNELRGTRAVPLRSEVNPRRIENCLEYAFIVERIAPGLARFRLAGTHLNELIGMEVRGMPLTSIFAPEARGALSDTLEEVFAGPASATLSVSAVSGAGKPPMEGRMLLLPLKSDFGDVTRALGCLVTHGPIGHAPRRFVCTGSTLDQVGPRSPKSAAEPTVKPRPIGLQQMATPHMVTGFNEAQSAFKGKPAAPKRPETDRARSRPYLYLVSSNN